MTPSDSTRLVRQLQRPWPPRARAAAAIIAAAGLAVLAAACGGSSGTRLAQLRSTTTQTSTTSSNTSAASAPQTGALAFARCIRAHGVSNWPDPNSSGNFPASTKRIATSNPRFEAAQTACQRLLPNGGPGPSTQVVLRYAWSDSRNFARCMRSHGVSNWPDPTSDPAHHPERPTFNLQPVGIDQSSPQITTKIRECEPLLHGWAPYVDTGAGSTFLGGS